MSALMALLGGTVLGGALAYAASRRQVGFVALADALGRIRDGDTSVRVRLAASGPSRQAVDELNRLAEGLAVERDAAYQQQLLLTTVVERAPQTILLVYAFTG
jgi:hypothetical protein